MENLNELITRLCPDGVEYKSIGSVIKRERKKGKEDPQVSQVYVVSNTLGIVKSEDYHDNEIHSEDTSNYTIIRPGMFAYNPSRLNIGSIGSLEYEQAGLVSPMYVVFSLDNDFVTRDYFWYLLKSSYVKYKINALKEEGARFRFDFDRWSKIEIPIPPKEIQIVIVTILDEMNSLINGLNDELVNRKKQASFYLEKMLSELKDSEYEELTVQDMIDRKMIEEPMDGNHGAIHPKKADYVESGVPFIMANDLVGGKVDFSNCAFITEKQAKGLRKGFAKPGDVLITHKGTIGRTAIVSEEYEYIILTPQVTYYRILNGIDNRYLKYFFESEGFQKQMNKMASLGGTRAYIGITAQHELSVKLPKMDVQKRIVDFMEKFDVLCNSTTDGIPAEIEARQKQYEYYRDKLLTFK